uniref:Serine-threonine/tyrosine-protein kinase catalytic domain-containing protein n=1 Tax=Solanum lycopersicum TaxID=4081 RepID=K4D0Y3_SOLLC
MNSYTRNFSAPFMKYPEILVKLQCCTFGINLNSLSNSVCPWREVMSCFFPGVPENGVEIAVKKKDMTLRHEFTEFENEVNLIAKLQHRNVRKFLGYCMNRAGKFLVYEFRSNNSLHKVIYDPTGRGKVIWPIYNVKLRICCNFSAVQKFEARASLKN